MRYQSDCQLDADNIDSRKKKVKIIFKMKIATVN